MNKILLDTITGFVTAPDTTETEITLSTGDSFQIRNAAKCHVLPIMGLFQGAGITRVRASSMHDPTVGVVAHHLTGAEFDISPKRLNVVGARDSLVITNSGSATGGDIEVVAVPVLYEDPMGIPAGQFITPQELLIRRTGKIATAYATLTAGTAGIIAGSKALSSFTHLMPGGKNYAIVGLTTTVAQACITIKGPCTGNARIAVPGIATQRWLTSMYFVDLSNQLLRGLIPVINTNDFSLTTVECLNNENAASPIVDIYFEELAV